jgi:tripartite-type tricarboxylate transporter receptor subunit TctC
MYHGEKGGDHLTCRIGTAALFGLGAACAQAADPSYPSKPIRMLFGFPTGAGADVAARAIAKRTRVAREASIKADSQ